MGFASLLLLVAALALSISALAQAPPPNLPPPGAYQPIPNYVGAGAGALFRGAINDRFSGVVPTSPQIVKLPLASLPAEQDGQLIYCSDCQQAIPCAGGGGGAWAFGQRGQWSCAAPGASGPVVATSLSAAGPVSITGTGAGSGAADQISKVSVNGVINVTAAPYGAVSSTTTETAATTAGSAVVTLSAAGDFANGQGVALAGAGPAPTISPPVPTLGSYGTAGSTSRCYEIVLEDQNAALTAPGTAACVSNANASPSPTNYVTLSWTNPAGTYYAGVYESVNSGAYALIGTTMGSSWNAVDLPHETPSNSYFPSAPPSASNGYLLTTISSGGGTVNLTLAATASATVSGATLRHDNTAAFVSAFATAGANNPVLVPIGTFFVRTIALPADFYLEGQNRGQSIIESMPGYDALYESNQGQAYSYLNDLEIYGGQNCFHVTSAVGGGTGYFTFLHVNRALFACNDSDVLANADDVEEWVFDDVELTGGNYGFRSGSTPLYAYGAPGWGDNRFDKNIFTGVHANGQVYNGWHLTGAAGGTDQWILPRIIHSNQHGFYADMGLIGSILANVNTEGNGYNSAKTAHTTGSIASGSTSLSVASASGFSAGDSIFIDGAGSSGGQLATAIQSISGTTFTLAAAASATVSNAITTNALYCDFYLTNSGQSGEAPNLLFSGGLIGSQNGAPGGPLRAAICGGGGELVGMSAGVPGLVEDYNDQWGAFNSSVVLERSPLLVSFFPSETTSIGTGIVGIVPNVNYDELISPPGGNLMLVLKDSLGNTSGAFGELEFCVSNSNRNCPWRMDGSGNLSSMNNGNVVMNGNRIEALPAPAAAADALSEGAPIGAHQAASGVFTQVIDKCKTSVTLASGTATWSNGCITGADMIFCRDTTTPANVCYESAQSAGSATITGTGTDACACAQL